jgi:hypothetical protein
MARRWLRASAVERSRQNSWKIGKNKPFFGLRARVPVIDACMHENSAHIPDNHIKEAKSFADRLVEEMRRLTTQLRVADLDLARVLVWLRHADLARFGWTSFSSWCTAHLAWGSTWRRQLMRLVSAPLPLVQAAVREGSLSLSKAVEAPGQTDGAGEGAWLRGRQAVRARPLELRVAHTEDAEIEVLVAARERASLLVGRALEAREADAFVRDAWCAQVDPAQLLAQALAVPPAPEPTPDLPDPPANVPEAFAAVETLQGATRVARLRLGRLFDKMRQEHLLWVAGFDTYQQLADHLGLALRTLQSWALFGQNLTLYPALQTAYLTGMSANRVELLADIAEETTVERWIAVAGRVPVAELKRAVQAAVNEGAEAVLDRYEHTAPNTVALQSSRQAPKRPSVIFADVDQVEAARWFVEHVTLPPRRGYGRAAERDDYACQNPRCEHRSVRIHVHHVVYQRVGGPDDPENLIALCPACHLRGVHAGHIRVVREGPHLVWTYPCGQTITVHGAAQPWASSRARAGPDQATTSAHRKQSSRV